MNDLPYLEPLLLHLREDEVLKKYFTNKSFFMPKHTLIEAAKEAMAKDCPAPRSIWVVPQTTSATNPRAGCSGEKEHTFTIIIFIHCIRDAFQLVKSDNGIKLGGQFMELSKIRLAVKRSVNEFQNKIANDLSLPFHDVTWLRDNSLNPSDSFLVTGLLYSVKLN